MQIAGVRTFYSHGWEEEIVKMIGKNLKYK